MTAVTLVPAGQGEVVGDAPDRRVEILSDDPSLNATWSRFAPGRDGADLHVHHHHADHFFVLEGELTVRLGPGGDGVAVPAGSLARVPPGVIHGFRNTSETEVRFLNLHAPGRGFADYMRALRDQRKLAYDQHEPPPDGGRPTSEAVFAADGPTTDEPGLRSVVLADHDEIAVRKAVCDAESGEPATRVHPRHVASLYVLEGELAVTVGDQDLLASTGAWVQIPAGVPHALARPASFLDIRTPA